MRKYAIEIKISARKSLRALDPKSQERIRKAIDRLIDNPRPPGSTKLNGRDNSWRIRVGDYRVLYEIHDGRILVFVFQIGHRREIYR